MTDHISHWLPFCRHCPKGDRLWTLKCACGTLVAESKFQLFPQQATPRTCTSCFRTGKSDHCLEEQDLICDLRGYVGVTCGLREKGLSSGLSGVRRESLRSETPVRRPECQSSCRPVGLSAIPSRRHGRANLLASLAFPVEDTGDVCRGVVCRGAWRWRPHHRTRHGMLEDSRI